ncbi:P-loop containing nucleoside triphosphate hydrolase protein [Tothia fuscella]|uniref:P-loop containing nucleoside triphosphate hydrolase protein n=1 Tax=Tothia fuscella TaxID=1048955 RepID=A0A9P4NY61_9PEZI|nr:P-loop containing nucleoside triphosphate hydrolase protein [Tothia fuscella]
MSSQMGNNSQVVPSSSSHRLPTVSASDALRQLRDEAPLAVSTGLPRLDEILSGQMVGPGSSIVPSKGGGLVRGQITEIHGPPGVGKTSFCSALYSGKSVVWIDASSPMAFSRFNQMLTTKGNSGVITTPKTQNAVFPTLEEMHSRFKYYSAPTLAHLLSLLFHPPASFPPTNTSLIVIDSVSTLIENAYQRSQDHASKKTDAAKWAAGRKYAVMGELMSKLGRLAAVSNTAILVTNQTITKIRYGASAQLLPAISGAEWDNGISSQLVLFRDWVPRRSTQVIADDAEKWKGLRYAGVLKIKGVAAEEDGQFKIVVPFSIEEEGLVELSSSSTNLAVPILSSPTRPPKRPFDEIADSEGEEPLSEDDYGWNEPNDELLIKTTDQLTQPANVQPATLSLAQREHFPA